MARALKRSAKKAKGSKKTAPKRAAKAQKPIELCALLGSIYVQRCEQFLGLLLHRGRIFRQ